MSGADGSVDNPEEAISTAGGKLKDPFPRFTSAPSLKGKCGLKIENRERREKDRERERAERKMLR